MMTNSEHRLPAKQHKNAARKAEGFATPQQDKKLQCARILPKCVLPIIFLPGIMGSNLRMSQKRQQELKRKDNISWRPDILGAGNVRQNSKFSARERQLQLDPLETTVDIYDPAGPFDISGDGRHSNVELNKDFHSSLLVDDQVTIQNGRTAVQKARARGWGEVYFKSYGKLLQHLESRLGFTIFDGKVRDEWRDVIGVNPGAWQPHASLPQQAITEEELLNVVSGCWFPVYAFGYNWLQSNGRSAVDIASRINRVMEELNQSGYECNHVIVVTHSMGGLVGRALVHPSYGNMQDKILGVIHGVMPAIGAPAAYKRMKAGFEDPGLAFAAEASIAAKVSGNYGDEVTAVLANSPGGLQLLPTGSYGNGWLRIRHKGHDLESWPKNGDPYGEIYKIKRKWYALFREDWINPSGNLPIRGGGTFVRTCEYLDYAQSFHKQIANTFHPNSYAHYGADRQQASFGQVIWEIGENCADPSGWQEWPIISDSKQGKLELVRWDMLGRNAKNFVLVEEGVPDSIYATIAPPTSVGDQTVPAQSADYQLNSGVFKAVFRQSGYDHQSSYKNARVIAATLYSIIRIAQSANWRCKI